MHPIFYAWESYAYKPNILIKDMTALLITFLLEGHGHCKRLSESMKSRTPCNLPWGNISIHKLQLIGVPKAVGGKKQSVKAYYQTYNRK